MVDKVPDVEPAVDRRTDLRLTGKDTQQVKRKELVRRFAAAVKQGAEAPAGNTQKAGWSANAGSGSQDQSAERKTDTEALPFQDQLNYPPLRLTLAMNASALPPAGETAAGSAAQTGPRAGAGADRQPQPPAFDAGFTPGGRSNFSPAIHYPSKDAARLYQVYGAGNAGNAYSYVPSGGSPYNGPAYEHTLPPSVKNDNVETFRANNWIGKAYSAGVNSPSFMALSPTQKGKEALDYNDYIAKKHDLAYDNAQQQLLTNLDKGPGTGLDSLKTYYDGLAKSDTQLLKDREALVKQWDKYEADKAAAEKAGKNVPPPPTMTVPHDGLLGDQDKKLDIYNSDWSRFIGGLPMSWGISRTGNAEDAARVADYQSAIKQATKDGVVDSKLLPDNEYGNDLKKYFGRNQTTMDPKLLDAYAAAAFIERGQTSPSGEPPKVVGKALMDKLSQLRQNITALGGDVRLLPLGRDMKTPGGRPPRQGPFVLQNQDEVDAYYRDAYTGNAN